MAFNERRRSVDKRVCPVICPHAQHARGEQCIANEPPSPKHTAKVAPAREPRPAPAAAAPTPNSGCTVFVDRNAFNGVYGPPGCR
jgi:hypothetical protein